MYPYWMFSTYLSVCLFVLSLSHWDTKQYHGFLCPRALSTYGSLVSTQILLTECIFHTQQVLKKGVVNECVFE